MASGGNYSFFNHNLGTSAMKQAFDRPKLLQHRQTVEKRLETFESSNQSENVPTVRQITVKEGVQENAQLIPHPPSSPRSNKADNLRVAAVLNSKGKKRLRHESPRTSPSDSDDEKRLHKLGHNTKLEPLERRGSTGSLDSIGSTESVSSRTNRNIRGIEPLKDIGSDKQLVNSFKSYQSSAKNDGLSKKILKQNVVHPLRVTEEPTELKCEVLPQSFPIKSTSEQPPLLNNTCPPDDDVTLSSDDSLTSVSGSEEDSLIDSGDEGTNEKPASRRDPNSTLPTLPDPSADKTLEKNSSGLYESISATDRDGDKVKRNSTSDLKKLSKALSKVATGDEMYASDTELSIRSTGQGSIVSNLSILPRLPASRARMRTGSFLKEEMDRYFPDRQIGVFVATWNMHEEKVCFV